jgi:hypothetical protein
VFFRWLWAEAGAQQALEDSLEIGGFGYPVSSFDIFYICSPLSSFFFLEYVYEEYFQ